MGRFCFDPPWDPAEVQCSYAGNQCGSDQMHGDFVLVHRLFSCRIVIPGVCFLKTVHGKLHDFRASLLTASFLPLPSCPVHSQSAAEFEHELKAFPYRNLRSAGKSWPGRGGLKFCESEKQGWVEIPMSFPAVLCPLPSANQHP